jgi:hypothetical protein
MVGAGRTATHPKPFKPQPFGLAMVRRETITGSHGMYASRTLVRQPNSCSNLPILEVCNLLIAGMLQIG